MKNNLTLHIPILIQLHHQTDKFSNIVFFRRV